MSMVQQGGAFVYAIMECMLQSQKNEIKIFPVPLKCFGERLSFHNLAAEGGLTVSASKDKRGIIGLEIVCGKEPWSGKVRLFGEYMPDKLLHWGCKKNGANHAECVVDGAVTVSLTPGESLFWKRNDFACLDAPPHRPGVRSYGKNCPIGYGDAVSYSGR